MEVTGHYCVSWMQLGEEKTQKSGGGVTKGNYTFINANLVVTRYFFYSIIYVKAHLLTASSFLF